jgi:mRNA-degrading endonuclease RelE of RelBE toxin-antitoxin system
MSDIRPVVLADQVVGFAAKLHPEHRRQIKTALKGLESMRGDILALENEFAGLYRLRAGPFRIVFRYEANGRIVCLFIERRRLVYDLLRQRPDLWG